MLEWVGGLVHIPIGKGHTHMSSQYTLPSTSFPAQSPGWPLKGHAGPYCEHDMEARYSLLGIFSDNRGHVTPTLIVYPTQCGCISSHEGVPPGQTLEFPAFSVPASQYVGRNPTSLSRYYLLSTFYTCAIRACHVVGCGFELICVQVYYPLPGVKVSLKLCVYSMVH